VEILEDHEHRLHLALAEQQALDGVERSPAPLRGIESRPLRVLDGHVEQRQQGGETRLEGPVQREQLAGDLLLDLAGAFLIVDLEVSLEEIK
jgi:hypothetical protein